ncbi:hypothetical protein PSZ80_09065, partial [Shigella sonnei]|nr:hypothetical protein [Shigella sonnei]MDD0422629.1 hypothetical protein [Shigella sonnei]MDD0427027.1 hypothetical protein [Shigella sonnei]MDD0431361.1 hypothetical protein [Shigella sonnei]MDD0458215.1 hypothetical protein [Shigella sonnei]
FFCSLLAPSDAILFQEGVSVKLRLPQISLLAKEKPVEGSPLFLLQMCMEQLVAIGKI